MPEGPINTPAINTSHAITPRVGAFNAASTAAGPSSLAPAPPAPGKPPTETPKETVMSIIIAFALAFVFRGFVIEAFVIPTGSMAPTLMGQHMKFQDRESGNTWAVGPWQAVGRSTYKPVQTDIVVTDPISGSVHSKQRVPLSSGDRILVLKYLYTIFEPQRFDVVVFKSPHVPASPIVPTDNYIKRLIGLPGEQVALVDGDVFTRKPQASDPAVIDPLTFWELPGWAIARKDALHQTAVWQTVFDSAYAPVPTPSTFVQPWASKEPGWDFTNPRIYLYEGALPTTLVFDQTRTRFNDPSLPAVRRATWAITDRYAYNDGVPGDDPWQNRGFAVSDVRLRAGIEPTTAALGVTLDLRMRTHEFQAQIVPATGAAPAEVVLKVREPIGGAGVMAWRTIKSARIAPLKPGRVTNIEFWHVDQSLRVYVDEELVIGPEPLDWTPAQRIQYSTGERLVDILKRQPSSSRGNVLAEPELYRRAAAQASITLAGGGARLYRVAIDRDLHYRPDTYRQPDPRTENRPAIGTSPFSPLVLRADQFFCCGDNSPQSLDGRLWGYPEPWVGLEFGDDAGVVPRDLMLGRAFFVYWPSLIKERGPLPVPDFGRMRFIW